MLHRALSVMLLLLPCAAASAQDARLAVLDVDAASLQKRDRVKLDVAVRAGVASGARDPRVVVVAPAELKQALKRARPCAGDPAHCAREQGRAAAADLVVATSVRRQAGKSRLRVVLLDVASGRALAEVARESRTARDLHEGLSHDVANLVAEGLAARAPAQPAAAPPAPRPPEAPGTPTAAAAERAPGRSSTGSAKGAKDQFRRKVAASLVSASAVVEGTLTLTATSLSFEPDPKATLKQYEEIELHEVAAVHKANHLLVLPTGIEIVTTRGRTVRLVVAEDRDRLVDLLRTRVDLARRERPEQGRR